MSNLECVACGYQGLEFKEMRCPKCRSRNLASDEDFLEPLWDEEVFVSNEEIAKEPSRD